MFYFLPFLDMHMNTKGKNDRINEGRTIGKERFWKKSKKEHV